MRKYVLLPVALALCTGMVFGIPVHGSGEASFVDPVVLPPPLDLDLAVPSLETDTTGVNLNAPDTWADPGRREQFPTTTGEAPVFPVHEEPYRPVAHPDSIPPAGRFLPDSYYQSDTAGDISAIMPDDSLVADSMIMTPAQPLGHSNFLNSPIISRAQDSMVYDVRSNKVYLYRSADILYETSNLKADFMELDMATKDIYAHGVTDSTTAGVSATRPELVEDGHPFTMDTITYNIDTKKALVKGTATKEGDGYLIAEKIKLMPDKTVNLQHGKYTTCDDIDHPHFYMLVTKGKMIPNEKIVFGPMYFVMEDVKIPFLGLPFGFFPLSTGRSSGFIVPSFGEEVVKGFYLRDGGYYFAFNDYVDVTLTGGIYTLGSWSLRGQSRYLKRYKYSGGLSANFSKDIIGEKGSADYVNMNNFNLQWTHRQDPKFRPSSNFSASVNFSTSGYSKYGSTTMNDYLNTQTNSSIAYSKVWTGKHGGTVSMSTNMQHSQNSRDSTITLNFPNISLSMSRRTPFKRRGANAVGKERWYEKISFSYSGNITNSLSNVKEYDFFNSDVIKSKMRNGMRHTIPVSASFSLFNYFNITPNISYGERWSMRKVEREWDPEMNAVRQDTTYGFYRTYDYSFSASMSTKVYGEFQFTGKDPVVRAIRHVITPSASISYSPDFGDPKYGFYRSYQSDSTGTISTYSPYDAGAYGVPGRGASARLTFSLGNTLEMKVRNKGDTTGMKKIKVIDNFSLGGSYNFLADSLKLSVISLSLRSTIVKGVGLNLSGSLDPYQVDDRGRRINRMYWKDGKIGRLASLSTSFGYSFNSGRGGGSSGNQPSVNDVNSGMVNTTDANQMDFMNDPENDLDPATRRALMTSQYYDFSMPWNLSFNYSFGYRNSGIRKDITQTLSFNGSVTLTRKWGVTFNGGYDFKDKKLTPGVFTVNRDLHCWQMSFSWVPVGYRKSWSFNIHVKSSVLRDIKYDRTNSHYDNLIN